MNSIPTPQALDATFSALANEHRRQMIHALAQQPWSIGALADQRNLSLPAIHKHVKVLEAAGLIERKKHGRTNFLALRRGAITVLQDWTEEFHTYWGSDEESLSNYVEFLDRQKRKEG